MMTCSSPTASASLPTSGYLFAARTFWTSGQISSSGCRYRTESSLDWRYSSRARFALIEAQPAEATTNAAVVHAAGRYIAFTGERRGFPAAARRRKAKSPSGQTVLAAPGSRGALHFRALMAASLVG